MLDPKITELANNMIELQFHERTKQLERDILHAQNDAAVRGMGHSSALVETIFDLCTRDIELRSIIVWQNLFRVLSQAGIVPSASLANDLKQSVSSYGDAIYAEPCGRFNSIVTNAGFTPQQSLGDEKDRALKKVYAEIDLFVLGLQQSHQAEADSSPPVYIFNSPVGAVQTGPNANATVSQPINEQDRQALIHAFETIQQALSVVDRLPAYPKEEILELVAEARTESERVQPNGVKLTSVSMAIATAIQTVGSLQPAYKTLKAALLPFGITMP